MRIPRSLTASLIVVALTATAAAQSWNGPVHRPTFAAGTALLLTNGNVMVQAMSNGLGTGQWWI